jgi:hypothetical protein
VVVVVVVVGVGGRIPHLKQTKPLANFWLLYVIRILIKKPTECQININLFQNVQDTVS